ncbi:hypothetical protein HYZ97_02470 [Candidatus Pacearchaeota archaeon]|nr:hypothetical protein [Candidatus Pacearchaeota archaeon]
MSNLENFLRHPVDMDEFEKNQESAIREELEALKGLHKPLAELVVQGNFEVIGALQKVSQTSIYPEGAIGGPAPGPYLTGQITSNIFSVRPLDESVSQVKELVFNAPSRVMPGNSICAVIPAYEIVRSRLFASFFSGSDREVIGTNVFYHTRALGSKETAIQIVLCNEKGQVIERAPEYGKFYY